MYPHQYKEAKYKSMKRIGFVPGEPGTSLFDAICDSENIYQAHCLASRGKSWYTEVKMVNGNLPYYLNQIERSLREHTFHTSQYEIEDRYDGIKLRTIYKLPYYPDRIVQWAILHVIGSILESKMISTTYSSIKNRGPYQCMQHVYHDLKKDRDGTFYCMKLDIRKFYPSIDHEYLKGLYAMTFKDPNLLWLLFDIIDSTPNDSGIPIGNYLSQYSGNYFLTPFDHWVKENTDIKYYYRYMDDMVLLHQSKNYLHDVLNNINDKMAEMHLSLKPNYQIFPVNSRGIDFVGYVIYHDKCMIRKRIVNNYKKCVMYINSLPIDKITDHHMQSYFSYKGLIMHGDTEFLHKKYGIPLERRLNWDKI